MFANAGFLFRCATESQRSASSLNPTSEQAQRESLSSVFFAAMSTEAFVNELPRLAEEAAGGPFEPEWVRALSEVVGSAEDSHASNQSKFHLAKLVLTGKVFDKGTEPFQSFSLLVDVRNLVVHAKSDEALRYQVDMDWVWETKIMTRLEAWGVHAADGLIPQFIPPNEAARIKSNLLAEVSTEAVARKAFGAAAGIVNAVLDAIPDSPRFKGLLETIYRKDFRLS